MSHSSPPKSVTVIVLSGGRLEALAECLHFLSQGSRLPQELVLVDNDLSGKTAFAVEKLELPFPLVRIQGQGRGYGELRNAGVEAASSEAVAFLDDDCYADCRWLELLSDEMRFADAVGGVVLPARDLRVPSDFSPELNWAVGLSTPGLLGPTGGMVDLPSTSNLGFRRAVWERFPFQELGGRLEDVQADTNYRIGREDANWWRTLRREGVSTRIARRAIVWHDIDKSRYRVFRLRERISNDGATHWTREKRHQELPQAATDVLEAPIRAIRDSLEPDISLSSAWRRHLLWARRQSALLGAAVDDQNADFSPQARAGAYLSAVCRAASHLVRPPLRHGIAAVNREVRPPGTLPSPDNPPDRLLVVCYPFIGDALLCRGMLEAITNAYPHCKTTFLVSGAAATLYEDSDLAEIVILPAGMISYSPRAIRMVWGIVRKVRPDAIILAYYHQGPPAPIFFATRAPVICWDWDHGMAQVLWQDLAAKVVHKEALKVEPAAQLDLLAPLGIRTQLVRPAWKPPARAIEKADKILRRLKLEAGDFAVIALDGEEGHRKFWPVDRWGEVARYLFENHGLKILFDGRRQCRHLFEKLNLPEEMAVPLHGILDPAELGALLTRARICLGVDSAPQHLAQAVGTPTVMLFGPVDERRWGPMPRLMCDGEGPLPFRALRAPAAPADWHPHERLGLPEDIFMQRLETERVILAAEEVLRESAALDP